MIVFLAIFFIVILILAWVTLMGVWWQKEHKGENPLSSETIVTYGEFCARLARRGWYRCTFYFEKALSWSTRKLSKGFFILFPGAVPAFQKKDELAGFKHGPSSFFLKSISEKPKRTTRKRV